MKVRKFNVSDIHLLISLFRDTVHEICKDDYTNEQLNAWAPSDISEEKWTKRFLNSYTLVVEESGEILGFANLEDNGNVDMFYVSKSSQGQGVGKIPMTEIESYAKTKSLDKLTSDVSISAKEFFLKMGFVLDKNYIKTVNEIEFRNNLMSKKLS